MNRVDTNVYFSEKRAQSFEHDVEAHPAESNLVRFKVNWFHVAVDDFHGK